MLLRPARPGDLDDLHAILSDVRSMRYWSTPPHAEIGQTADWLADTMAIPPEEGEDFVIEREGRVIGKAGLYRFPEIGFILHPDHWRQGLAREALAAVIHRAFTVHRLPRILADVDPDNAASLALLRGLGFLETGRAERTWLVGGRWCDSVYLALDAGDRRVGR
ncbi:GNAT family N-acetyltransferase [Rhizorhabdus phycosphaerae]|uniref:GNAT family N-acetyltransferase n=1 Tax=Rhizorhabdus phycosphaerae TaxID=2711156 RepID=UPI0031EDEE3A